MKFMDQWLAPSFSMIGWSVFIGPAVRAKDPEMLKAAIERIPLPERRVAWRKAIYGSFGEAEMQLADFIATLAGAAFEHLLGNETRFRSLAQNSSDVITLLARDGTVVRYDVYIAIHSEIVFGVISSEDPAKSVIHDTGYGIHPYFACS